MLERLAARHDVAGAADPARPPARARPQASPRRRRSATPSGSGSRCSSRSGRRPSSSSRPTRSSSPPTALLIPRALLERGLWLNVHPSLLPRWRGAAPVERALLAGDTETGVTIHETVKELDAGPIAAQRAFPIGPEDDAGAVYARAAELAVELLDEVLRSPSFTPQAGRADLRGEDRAGRPRARLVAAGGEPATGSGRSRRTSAPAASSTAAR